MTNAFLICGLIAKVSWCVRRTIIKIECVIKPLGLESGTLDRVVIRENQEVEPFEIDVAFHLPLVNFGKKVEHSDTAHKIWVALLWAQNLLKVGWKAYQPSSRIWKAPPSEKSISLWAFRPQAVLMKFDCSELDYALSSLQRVCHPPRETGSYIKNSYQGKHDLTTWVVNNGEKHRVYILWKVHLTFIK